MYMYMHVMYCTCTTTYVYMYIHNVTGFYFKSCLRHLIFFSRKKKELSLGVVALHGLVSMAELGQLIFCLERNGAVFMCCCFALPCLYDRIYMYLSADQHLREGVSLWWLQDTRFKIPRVNMHCSIESVGAEKSPRWMGTLHGCILYWYRYTVGFKIKFPLPSRCTTVLRCLPFPFRFHFLTVFLLPSENTVKTHSKNGKLRSRFLMSQVQQQCHEAHQQLTKGPRHREPQRHAPSLPPRHLEPL